MRILRRNTVVCQDAVEFVTDYLEGALSDRDRRRLEDHLEGCVHCRAYFDQMRSVIQASGSVQAEDLTPEAWTELIDLYRRWRSG